MQGSGLSLNGVPFWASSFAWAFFGTSRMTSLCPLGRKETRINLGLPIMHFSLSQKMIFRACFLYGGRRDYRVPKWRSWLPLKSGYFSFLLRLKRLLRRSLCTCTFSYVALINLEKKHSLYSVNLSTNSNCSWCLYRSPNYDWGTGPYS